jgi:NADH dehydrogenase
VIVGSAVTRCDAAGVSLADGSAIKASCVLWAAGVMASRAAKWLDAAADRAGRVVVRSDLTVDGFPEIFVIGDTAAVNDTAGRQVPGVAPAAKQMGRYVARAIRLRLVDSHPGPFRYSDPGNLATIGRSAAVADLGRVKLTGSVAWLLWSFAHLWFLVGYRSRFTVFFDWIWAYATFDRSARLITGRDGH